MNSLILCIPTLSPAGADRTVRLIESAIRGTLAPSQILVVDNGGHFSEKTTGTWRDDHLVSVFAPGKNIGVGPAWNEALRRFRGMWVIFANDDITLALDSINILDRTCRNEGAMMVGTEGHSFSLFLMHPHLVWKVGYFDEGFAPAYYEDTDYLRRMRVAGVERVIVETGAKHVEQSTSRDMGWDASELINQQSIRYDLKWGGLPGRETNQHPWGIDFEVCIPSCNPGNLQRLIDSLAWQTVRPSGVVIASNADLGDLDTRGLRVRQVKFWSNDYAIGDGDVSLRRNVATWAAASPYIVYSDDDQVWPQNAMEWFRRRFATGDHFVVGHHRFIDGLESKWRDLRAAEPDVGVSRERHPNQWHLWQSCWGGCVGANAMLIKYGVGGWDMGYPAGEDQQLAQRIVGNGDDSEVRVHEPPWAWHEKDAVHQAPWEEPHRNTCPTSGTGTHEMRAADEGLLRCAKCPLVRRNDITKWPTVQLYDPSKVQTEEHEL